METQTRSWEKQTSWSSDSDSVMATPDPGQDSGLQAVRVDLKLDQNRAEAPSWTLFWCRNVTDHLV